MKCDKYQRIAIECADYGEGQPITYPVFGLCGEMAELLAECHRRDPFNYDAFIGEVGDVLWYATALASDIDQPLSYVLGVGDLKDVTPASASIRNLPMFVGDVAEQVKKALRDDHGQFGRRIDRISLALCGVVKCLQGITMKYRGTLNEAAKMNVSKIKAKYEKKGAVG